MVVRTTGLQLVINKSDKHDIIRVIGAGICSA
jgi:hypothetical protein